MRAAFAELTTALDETGLAYTAPGERNHEVLTDVGTVKSTYCLPRSMQPGAAALAAGVPCLLVDFEGLREYSAKAVAAGAAARWPGVRTLRLTFPAPGIAGEVYAAHIALALEERAARERLADLVRPHLGDARAVGLPAVLGIMRTDRAAAHLAEALGVPVFEVPTMPTSVPGLRLKNALERAVAARGVERRVHGRVVAVERTGDQFELSVAATPAPAALHARAVILATGRFMGRGLEASRTRVREPLLDLYVSQPATRSDWHRADLFDARATRSTAPGSRRTRAFAPATPAAPSCSRGSLPWHDARAPRLGAHEMRGRAGHRHGRRRGRASRRRAGPLAESLVTPFGWAVALAAAVAVGGSLWRAASWLRLGLPDAPSSARERGRCRVG